MDLRLSKVCKSYQGAGGPVSVLNDLDLDLKSGETLALTGESGCGKSTLMHLVAGLDHVDSGEIWLDHQNIANFNDKQRAALRREKIGVIFQQFNLVPSLNIHANIAFQARLTRKLSNSQVLDLAHRLGIADHLDKYPEQLSGGQQQRVAIARTLAAAPALVLADEPTGNLDEDTADQVMDLMGEMVADTGASLLVVTHSDRVAQRMNRQVRLSHGRIK